MQRVVILSAILALASCRNQSGKYYSVITEVRDNGVLGSEERQDTMVITATSDSSAFMEACEVYWSHKAIAVKVYKQFPSIPPSMPIYFVLLNDKYEHVDISEERKQQLSAAVVHRYRDSIMPSLDTIQPYQQPKEADIY